MPKNDILVVQCPYCGEMMDTPYVYDGTYEITHGEFYYWNGEFMENGCTQTFYVAILNGRLHVHKTEQSLKAMLEKFVK